MSIIDEALKLERRLTSEERAHEQTIGERDRIQELFDELYVAFFGESPEYSNLFSATDAFNEMDARLSQLKGLQDDGSKQAVRPEDQ